MCKACADLHMLYTSKKSGSHLKVTLAHISEGGQGGLNLPLPVPFNPRSRPVFFGSCPFAFFDCEILRNVA